MSEIMNSLKVAAETGRIVLGAKQTIKGVQKKAVKLVVVTSNAPESEARKLVALANQSGVKVYKFPGNGWDLAALCTRSHVVSSLGIIDAGESDIFSKIE
jgi:large subunit ribosomal protein L30e